MKEKEYFQKIRNRKSGISLASRLTLFIGILVIISIISSFGIVTLLSRLLPFSSRIPLLLQLVIFSFIMSIIFSRFLSKSFFDPIRQLREGMQRVADGDFNTTLDAKSTSAEMKELFAGFNLMTKELRSTEILQTDFVSNVSHEFKTPINAIEGYTTLLQSADNLDKTENEYIEKILFNTRRLSSLVSNILLLSKIENLSIQTHKDRYSLDEQIRESIVALESAWEPKNIDFDVDLDSVEYYGNEVLMRHVWDNLISNAVKFSPENGEIIIRLRQKENDIIFTIEDNGPGLSDEAKKHIFDKFYQEDTSHKEEGNGLGLALVKRILTVANGDITAENRQKTGSIFTVTLRAENQ